MNSVTTTSPLGEAGKRHLLPYYHKELIEAGCDEAGRGCLAGSVYAAAVILPKDYENPLLNDSKQLTAKQRYVLREEIQRDAIAWALGIVTAPEIDQMNILRASITAMHRAIDALSVRPEALIIDGNRFYTYYENRDSAELRHPLPHTTIVKGDGKYLSIAAASILAKTYRDDYMKELHEQYPYCRLSHQGAPPRHQGTWHHALPPPHFQPPWRQPAFLRLWRLSRLHISVLCKIFPSKFGKCNHNPYICKNKYLYGKRKTKKQYGTTKRKEGQ